MEEFERLGREHAAVVLFKLLFAVLTKHLPDVHGEDLKAAALQALASTKRKPRDEFDVMIDSAAQDFVEQVFGRAGAKPPQSGRRRPRS